MNSSSGRDAAGLVMVGVLTAMTALGISSEAAGDWVRDSEMPTVGAVGDSLTDEYLEGEFFYALTWVQQLALFRDLDFGLTAAQANQPGGTWGEPRRTQYEYNWARYGATSESALSDGQHTGLAFQIDPFGIDYAFIAIGANDFSPALGTAYLAIYWNLWSESQRQSYINNIASRITTAVDTVLAEQPNLVLGNVPDYGVTPAVRAFFPNAARRQNVTIVINQLNAQIEQIAADRKIVLIDLAGLVTAVCGTNANPNEILLLGDVPIYLNEGDTPDNTNPQAAFLHDDAHPHTTMHGLFANVCLEALNIGYGENIVLFSEAEILNHAGLGYGGVDTLAGQIGAFADYVLDFTPAGPLGDLNGDGTVDVSDLLILLGAWGTCPSGQLCDADLNGDSEVDVSDLLLLLGNWG